MSFSLNNGLLESGAEQGDGALAIRDNLRAVKALLDSLQADIATIEASLAAKADASALNAKLDKSGGTLSGTLNLSGQNLSSVGALDSSTISSGLVTLGRMTPSVSSGGLIQLLGAVSVLFEVDSFGAGMDNFWCLRSAGQLVLSFA